MPTRLRNADGSYPPAGSMGKSDNTSVTVDHLAQDAFTALMGTIATTSATSTYFTAPYAGKLVLANFTAVDALAAHASNYVTFSITNLGQAGAGSTAMLAATDANTTKTTTGTAVSANTVRALALHGTAANLVVASGDRLQITSTAAATSANTMTFPTVHLVFERTA